GSRSGGRTRARRGTRASCSASICAAIASHRWRSTARATGTRATTTSTRAGFCAYNRAMLVGRDRELAALDRAIAERGVVVISGEPGIGKTRLLHEVAARSGGGVAWGRMVEG